MSRILLLIAIVLVSFVASFPSARTACAVDPVAPPMPVQESPKLLPLDVRLGSQPAPNLVELDEAACRHVEHWIANYLQACGQRPHQSDAELRAHERVLRKRYSGHEIETILGLTNPRRAKQIFARYAWICEDGTDGSLTLVGTPHDPLDACLVSEVRLTLDMWTSQPKSIEFKKPNDKALQSYAFSESRFEASPAKIAGNSTITPQPPRTVEYDTRVEAADNPIQRVNHEINIPEDQWLLTRWNRTTQQTSTLACDVLYFEYDAAQQVSKRGQGRLTFKRDAFDFLSLGPAQGELPESVSASNGRSYRLQQQPNIYWWRTPQFISMFDPAVQNRLTVLRDEPKNSNPRQSNGITLANHEQQSQDEEGGEEWTSLIPFPPCFTFTTDVPTPHQLEQHFDISLSQPDQRHLQIDLTPKQRREYRKISVRVDSRTMLTKALKFHGKDGTEKVYVFDNVQANQPIAQPQFGLQLNRIDVPAEAIQVINRSPM